MEVLSMASGCFSGQAESQDLAGVAEHSITEGRAGRTAAAADPQAIAQQAQACFWGLADLPGRQDSRQSNRGCLHQVSTQQAVQHPWLCLGMQAFRP